MIYAGSGSVVLTGGAGNDSFKFQGDDGGGSAADVVKKITDFTVGDRIMAATYQITIKDGDDAEEQVADLFEQIYLDENDGDHGRPCVSASRNSPNGKYTAIDVTHGTDAEDVITIEVAGHHHLQFAVDPFLRGMRKSHEACRCIRNSHPGRPRIATHANGHCACGRASWPVWC